MVALLEDKPSTGLVAGQVGTVVEVLATGVFEVEFLDSDGRTSEVGFAMVRIVEVSVTEVCVTEIRKSEVGATEIRAMLQ